MTQRIAATHGGTSYHEVGLNDPRWAELIDAKIYLRDLHAADLSAFDTLIITCRSNPDYLEANAEKLQAFANAGNTLMVFGCTDPGRWLPNISETPVAINYTWWLTPGADSGVRVVAPEHPLMQRIPHTDMNWHHHSLFSPPTGALSLVDHIDGGSIFYEDQVTTDGRLLITALDPFFHHGSYFMPATTRFLTSFIPWLKKYA